MTQELVSCPCGGTDNLEHLGSCIYYRDIKNYLIQRVRRIKYMHWTLLGCCHTIRGISSRDLDDIKTGARYNN